MFIILVTTTLGKGEPMDDLSLGKMIIEKFDDFSITLGHVVSTVESLQNAVSVSHSKIDAVYKRLNEVQTELHNHTLDDVKVQTELTTKITNLEKRFDRGDSDKGERLRALLSGMTVLVSFIIGATALLLQILKFWK